MIIVLFICDSSKVLAGVKSMLNLHDLQIIMLLFTFLSLGRAASLIDLNVALA